MTRRPSAWFRDLRGRSCGSDFEPFCIGGPGPAIEAGIAAYGDGNWIATMRKQLAQESDELAVVLESGLEIVGRNGLFVLARHKGAAMVLKALQTPDSCQAIPRPAWPSAVGCRGHRLR
ncbi:MAG: hypothetical protein R3D29_16580 [Nitratireductor sp.]